MLKSINMSGLPGITQAAVSWQSCCTKRRQEAPALVAARRACGVGLVGERLCGRGQLVWMCRSCCFGPVGVYTSLSEMRTWAAVHTCIFQFSANTSYGLLPPPLSPSLHYRAVCHVLRLLVAAPVLAVLLVASRVASASECVQTCMFIHTSRL